MECLFIGYEKYISGWNAKKAPKQFELKDISCTHGMNDDKENDFNEKLGKFAYEFGAIINNAEYNWTGSSYSGSPIVNKLTHEITALVAQ